MQSQHTNAMNLLFLIIICFVGVGVVVVVVVVGGGGGGGGWLTVVRFDCALSAMHACMVKDLYMHYTVLFTVQVSSSSLIIIITL